MISKDIANVISSGSQGNCEIYLGSIMVDCGVPYSSIKPYVKGLQIVLLTHSHLDHINVSTIEKLAFERPSLRFGMCKWMVELMPKTVRHIDVYDLGEWFDYGPFKVSPGKLYHDVENCFYRIHSDNYKIFRATDTAHLSGISAREYDLYAIELNYDEDTIDSVIENKKLRGEFCYQEGSVNTHLSEQAAREFIYNNRKPSSEVIRLHESSSKL